MEIKKFDTVVCGHYKNYEFSLSCENKDILRIKTKNMYNILVSTSDPLTYLIQEIDVTLGITQIYERLPLNSNIKTIKLNMGLIQ